MTAGPVAGELVSSEQARELTDQWRALRRAATAVALLSSPALFLWLHKHEGWSIAWSLLAIALAVFAFRGGLDLVFRRFIQWPSLFGIDSPAVREEDVAAAAASGSGGITQIRGFEPGDADWGVRLDDVRGQAEAKEEVRRVVSLWQSGEAFEQAGGKRERGLLFLGAPGTGKTMLAKAIATGFNSPIVTIPGSGFAQTFMGMDAVIVRWMAHKAKKLARKWGGQCFVFIDEIDAVGMRRQALGGGAPQETKLSSALFFRRQDLAAQLDKPLKTTLPHGRPPLPGGIDPHEKTTVDALTAEHLFRYLGVANANNFDQVVVLRPA